jgi:hypothetical protein
VSLYSFTFVLLSRRDHLAPSHLANTNVHFVRAFPVRLTARAIEPVVNVHPKRDVKGHEQNRPLRVQLAQKRLR